MKMSLSEKERQVLLGHLSPEAPEIVVNLSLKKGRLSRSLKASLVTAIQTIVREVQRKGRGVDGLTYWRDLLEEDKKKMMETLWPHVALIYGQGSIALAPCEEDKDEAFKKLVDREWEELWDGTLNLVAALKEAMSLPVRDYRALFKIFRLEVGVRDGLPVYTLSAGESAGRFLLNLLAFLQVLPGRFNICKECGILYYQRTKQRSYFCSNKCRDTWHNRRKKEGRRI